jgi:hypothetical protein
MPFQTLVNTRPVPALVGDWASDGPRFFYPAGPGGLVAGSAGVTIGRFAWISPTTIDFEGGPTICNSFGTGPVSGFVHRNQQGLITTYLAEYGMVIPQGFMLALVTGADIWIKNEGTTECNPGYVAYANFSNGAATFNAPGTPTQGTAGGSTSAIAAASSQTFVGSISGNILTVSTATNPVVLGSILSGGSGMAANTQIISQLTGSAGGVGTYVVSPSEQTVASATLTQSYGILTVNTSGSGFVVGAQVTGANVALPTYIWQLGSGTGGTGTYYVQGIGVPGSTTASAAAVSASSNVQTKWIAATSGLAGEVVRCYSQPLG